MSRFTPVRLTALAVMLFSLTFATIRMVRNEASSRSGDRESQVALGVITVPVEIIEAGKDPAVRQIHVEP